MMIVGFVLMFALLFFSLVLVANRIYASRETEVMRQFREAVDFLRKSKK
jgi:hypothetical protein